MWRYKEYLPNIKKSHLVSIGEGNTPLVKSRYIGPSLGLQNLYFKLENLNPTGSYKDRFASAFVSSLLEKNAGLCIATSSGNTGAALAAYCAAAKVECFLVIVDGAPHAKVRQIQLYGGKTFMAAGFGKDAGITKAVFDLLEQSAKAKKISLPISAYSYCPEGMVGVQTIAYEILDELNGNVNHIFSPSGGGGLTLAIAKGVLHHKKYPAVCKVNCVQPSGNNTIANPLRLGLLKAEEVPSSTTRISGLQVPGVLDGTETLLHCRRTGGNGYVVNDEDVFEIQKKLAFQEGVFCEAAGAVSISGLVNAVKQNEISADETVVCVITGSGFKEFAEASERFNLPDMENKVSLTELEKILSGI
ncbi:MAG TPA: pyridoxal-phosphate dependent enzyme [Sphingobacteriaceae bacterium]